MKVLRTLSLLALLGIWGAWAQQSTPYLLTQFPKAAMPSTMPDTVAWTGLARPFSTAPDSGVIYFDRSPGGSRIENYRYKISKIYVDSQVSSIDGQVNRSVIVQDNIYLPGMPPQRRIIFKPSEQTNMGYGLFYYIVVFKTKILGKDTSFTSNELEMVVESPTPVTLKAPLDTITDLTPTFSWEPNPGVPYYHVILSDEALNIDTVNGQMSVQGLSVAWQAITPNTQIVYGAPDPSGTITAAPPPMSPGKTYFWVVLNNYKNNMLYSSAKVGLPLSFTIKGKPLAKAVNITPKNVILTSDKDSVVTFKWTNLDPLANTYKIYLYIASGIQQVDAKMVAWSSEVTTATFAGKNGIIDASDTAALTINAHSVLSKNHYTWKVFAIDDKGASTSGDTSSFEYTDPATGRLVLYTEEKITSATALPTGTVITTNLSAVPAVQMQVDVVNGSLEAPLLFYTDLSGKLDRERPRGAYRITALKSGFEPLTKTITLDSGMIITDTFFLKRPDATVFGKVVDNTNIGVNVATVYAISDRYDTVATQTDALGSFIINCYEGAWQVYAQKTGYVASIPKQANVTYGQSYSFGSIALTLNPFSVSGIVKNEKGEPILGVDVRVLREGVVIDEMPSTSQTGAFSFSLSPGVYTITATKIGFETFSGPANVSSSMQVPVSMASGAAMIKGYVIGATWMGGKVVYAPITNASMAFTDTSVSPAKTYSATTDATYGDFGISVAGNHLYASTASAVGFVAKTERLLELTKSGTTMIYNDTLRSLGMITGTVMVSGKGDAIDNATISLLNPVTNQVAASAKSQGNGYFEIRNVGDGAYCVKAGVSGFVTDSMRASDTIYVSSGRTVIQGATNADGLIIFMSPGQKSISWVVTGANGASDSTAIISVQSPLQKIIRNGQSLTGAGYGEYIVSVNAAAPSTIDLVYHVFTVQPSEASHVDSVRLSVVNVTDTVLSIRQDSISVGLSATAPDTLDSARVFYRDISTPGFFSASLSGRGLSYAFSLRPPKDGSTMNYYFKAYRGKDIFGASNESFYTHIRPDTTRLSKLELMPSSGDTLLLGAKSLLRVKFQGYFGSLFIPAILRDTTAIIWKLLNAPKGTRFLDSTGAEAVLATGTDSSTAPVQLKVLIDTVKQRIAPQLPVPEIALFFHVSSKPLNAVTVRRIDAGNPNPITTSSLSMAEFIAEGKDASGRTLTISPQWSLSPVNAGAITALGVFKPARSFSGNVRIYAQANGLTGEYGAQGQSEKQFGLEVDHIIAARDRPDTASNQRGCMVILPDSVVASDKTGLLQIAMPTLDNRLQLTSGVSTVVGSAFDITEINGVNFVFRRGDSIRLVLDIPDAALKNISGGGAVLGIGTWSKDSLQWRALKNCVVNEGAKTVSTNITHFSRYAILAQSKDLTSTFSILPNPFSPEKRASEFPSLALRLGNNTPKGTCISFSADVLDKSVGQIRIAIYTVVGEQVAKVIFDGADKLTEYHLWWDGRTTDHAGTVWPKQSPKDFVMSGNALCRNGRYFVTLTIRNSGGKEKNYMKQVVLIK